MAKSERSRKRKPLKEHTLSLRERAGVRGHKNQKTTTYFAYAHSSPHKTIPGTKIAANIPPANFRQNPAPPFPFTINTLCYRSTPEHRNHHLQDEVTYRLLKLLESEPHLSKCEMTGQPGISLGKTNATSKSLIEKGLITIQEVIRQGPKTRSPTA